MEPLAEPTSAPKRRRTATHRARAGEGAGRQAASFALLATSVMVLLLGFGIGMAACSSAGSKATTGARSGSNRGPVVFDELPKYRDSKAVGSPNVHGTATTQTFTVKDATAQRILGYYAENLVGWKVTAPPHRLATGPQADWAGSWKRGGQRLLVSAAPTPDLGRGQVQYSLDLRSRGAPAT